MDNRAKMMCTNFLSSSSFVNESKIVKNSRILMTCEQEYSTQHQQDSVEEDEIWGKMAEDAKNEGFISPQESQSLLAHLKIA